MTWGEIQIISLQKMFAKDEPITVNNLTELRNDDDCKWYLSAMPAVANEAIQRIKPYVMNLYKYDEENKKYYYTAKIDLSSGGNYGYSFRVMPKHEMLLDSENLNLVKWITD